MKENIKILMETLQELGYASYYCGEKCRYEYYSSIDSSFAMKGYGFALNVNASVQELSRLFPAIKHSATKPWRMMINFGGDQIILETMHNEVYEPCNGNYKANIVEVDNVQTDFQRQIFTFNCVAQDVNGKYIATKQATDDFKKHQIRFLDCNIKFVEENPIRILKAFTLMSKTGYKFESKTSKCIKSGLKFLKNADISLIGKEIRRIVSNPFAIKTLQLMLSMKVFEQQCANGIILDTFAQYTSERFNAIENFSTYTTEYEAWSLLFDDSDIAMKELEKFNRFSDDELYTIKWLINNKDICNQSSDIDFRHAIYDSLTEFEKQRGIHYLKTLILHASHIYNIQNKNSEKSLKQTERLFYNMCARPYFVEQLSIDTSDANKEILLTHLLDVKIYPYTEELMIDYYNDLVEKGIFVNATKLDKKKKRDDDDEAFDSRQYQ